LRFPKNFKNNFVQRTRAYEAAFLPDRGVVKVSGDDARLSQRPCHHRRDAASPGLGRFRALLTRRARITVDFLITERRGPWRRFPDRLPARAGAGPRRQARFLQIARQVAVENLSDSLGGCAAWGWRAAVTDLFTDPRDAALGWRILVPAELAQKVAGLMGADLVDSAAYEAHRIASGVPRGGLDFMYGDAFPHETNMDRLHGVDFDKGCYVGQEVVSRMQHRGTARTRIVRVILEGPSPEPGAAVLAGDKPVGTMGSTAGHNGLALIRVDRAADAHAAGMPLTSGGLAIRVAEPDDLLIAPKQTVA
jgi:folate-binding protein YgfZ